MSQPECGREQLLSRAFVALSDTLVDDCDVIDLLDRLVGYSVELLATDAAGVMLADSRRILQVVASSQEDVEVMDLLQLRSDQGPCLECFRTGEPVDVPDLTDTAGRWPVFVAAVADQRLYRAMHAVPLRLRGEVIGAMSLYLHQRGALPDADLEIGRALADIATIGILQERAVRRGKVLTGQLQTALNDRVIIEQAKGVLANGGGLSMNAAFYRLLRYARRHRTLLSEVARKVVEADLAADVLSELTAESRTVHQR